MSASPTAAPAAPDSTITDSSTQPCATMKRNSSSSSPCWRGEREDGAEHQPVQPHDIERAEPEQESRAIREQAHHDVVRENLQRQHGGGHDVEQPFGPQLAALDGGDEIRRGEEIDEVRVRVAPSTRPTSTESMNSSDTQMMCGRSHRTTSGTWSRNRLHSA